MYFDPGIDSETKSEYWHSTLWEESSLFGDDQIKILEGIYNHIINFLYCYHHINYFVYNMIVIYKSGEFIYYHYNNERQLGRLRAILKNANNEYRLRIQEVVSYNSLPEIFKGRVKQERSITGEVWLKNEAYQMIAIS
ncbi:hypothetical protein RclHR1_40040002 [Rhizophagus clarus]|uniref:Uncharacterized protein n=1 Tax=Rhizophagus clarus TaxID=94130 RepID=A0A2Z6S9A3_9GLOM|nr:hypothetical protein RclHR1_40040002 [Rhizophagus clarus]